MIQGKKRAAGEHMLRLLGEVGRRMGGGQGHCPRPLPGLLPSCPHVQRDRAGLECLLLRRGWASKGTQDHSEAQEEGDWMPSPASVRSCTNVDWSISPVAGTSGQTSEAKPSGEMD